MSSLRPESRFLAALLHREEDCLPPTVWLRVLMWHMPEVQAWLNAHAPPALRVGSQAVDRWLQQLPPSKARLEWHLLMQQQLDAGRAAAMLGLPAEIAAGVAWQVPGPTCTHEQLRAAIQDRGTVLPLLRHLQQAAQEGSVPPMDCWHADALQAAFCGAARLGDLPLLDFYAAGLQQWHQRHLEEEEACEAAFEGARQQLQGGAQQAEGNDASEDEVGQQQEPPEDVLPGGDDVAELLALFDMPLEEGGPQLEAAQEAQLLHLALQHAQQAEWAEQRAELEWDMQHPWRQPTLLRRAAEAALLDAAATGCVATLRLAAAPTGGHPPSPAWQVLHPRFAPSTHLLYRAAIRFSQAAALSLLLARAAPPAPLGALVHEALTHGQIGAARALLTAASAGAVTVLMHNRCLLINHGPSVRQLLEDGCVPPSAVALVVAVRLASPAAVAALLAQSRTPVQIPPPVGGLQLRPAGSSVATQYACPVLAALALGVCKEPPPARELLRIMEALQAAGYRPAVYENVWVQRSFEQDPQLVPRFDPIAEDPGLDLQGANWLLWMALQRPEWSPQQHHLFMPHFQRAARTLLLAAHRAGCTAGGNSGSENGSGAEEGGSGGASLGDLPQHLVVKILGHAAYPLSAWTQGA